LNYLAASRQKGYVHFLGGPVGGACSQTNWKMKRNQNKSPPSTILRFEPFFLGVEQHRRAQTAQANFRPAAVLVPGQQRYAQTGVAAKKNYVHG